MRKRVTIDGQKVHDRGPGPRLHPAERAYLARECRLPARGRARHRPHFRSRQRLDRHAGDRHPPRRGRGLEARADLPAGRPVEARRRAGRHGGQRQRVRGPRHAHRQRDVAVAPTATASRPPRGSRAARRSSSATSSRSPSSPIRASPSRPGSRRPRRRTRSSPRGPAPTRWA